MSKLKGGIPPSLSKEECDKAIRNFETAVTKTYGAKVLSKNSGPRLLWVPGPGMPRPPPKGLTIQEQLNHMKEGTPIGLQLCRVWAKAFVK